MKFKVAKTPDLEPALSVVKASLGSGDDLESHLLFRVPAKGDGTTMEVLTHSGRVFSSCPFKAEVDASDGIKMFTIKESRLRMALNAFPADSVVTFETEDGKVIDVSVPGSSPSYQSLNPDDFPFWDSILEKAEVKATVNAKRLANALSFSRLFALADESRKPELCVCEIRDGVLASTDNSAAALLTLPGMKESALRMHGKDASSILAFLEGIDGNVEVLEYDRGVLFRRADGAVFGEGRFQAQFPAFGTPGDDDQCWWVLPINEIKTAMAVLRSAAKDKDQALTFSRVDDKSPVCLSMIATTGKVTKKDIPLVDSGSEDGEIFAGEFDVDFNSLQTLLRALGDAENVRFGVNRRKKGGYLRILSNPYKTDSEPGDEYLVILRWTRS